MAVTMTLALIAQRLVRRFKVMVTKLGTVETLGSVTLVASDKTGAFHCPISLVSQAPSRPIR